MQIKTSTALSSHRDEHSKLFPTPHETREEVGESGRDSNTRQERPAPSAGGRLKGRATAVR